MLESLKVGKLSDKQLYASVQNHLLSIEHKRVVLEEFNRRNFSTQHIDTLDQEFSKANNKQQHNLQLSTKILIIIFPWMFAIQGIIASRYLATGQTKKWKQHWFYVGVGVAVWTIFVILFSRIFLFNKS
jgi:hypothetical protein